jgi:diguanylate cyclase (GGDEF)-like protein
MSIKLRTYFAITFSILIFMTSAFLSITISKKSSSMLEKEVGDSLAAVAFQMADKLDYFMWSRFKEIQIISELEAVKQPEPTLEVQKLLTKLQESLPSFSWVGLTDQNGIVTSATKGILVGQNISERPVFQNAKNEPFIGDVHDAVLLAKLIPNKNGEPLQLVDISTPVYKSDGSFHGVLAAHLSWEWTKEIKNTVLQPLEGKRKDVEVFIVSSKDQTILLGPKNLVGQPLKLDLIHQSKNIWKLVTWPDGKKYLTGYAYGEGHKDYKGLGWTVIVRQPEQVAFTSVNNLQTFIFILGTIFSIIMAIIGWFLAGKISTPLQRIAVSANRLRNGENAEIPYIKGIKDIEDLSYSLRKLVSSLIKTESELGKMENIAMHDSLTGLPNRLSVYAYMNELTEQGKNELNHMTVLYLDLDGFKKVNDTLGHHTGDILLIETSKRIKAALKHNHFVARLGGDEFVIIISTDSPHPLEDARIIGDEIIRALNQPFYLNGKKSYIGCSIGAAVWKKHAEHPDEVLQNADKALYVSKRAGKNQINIYMKNRVS